MHLTARNGLGKSRWYSGERKNFVLVGDSQKVAIAIPSIPGEFYIIFYKTPKDIDILIV